jgi:VCBS repeat-containing protein
MKSTVRFFTLIVMVVLLASNLATSSPVRAGTFTYTDSTPAQVDAGTIDRVMTVSGFAANEVIKDINVTFTFDKIDNEAAGCTYGGSNVFNSETGFQMISPTGSTLSMVTPGVYTDGVHPGVVTITFDDSAATTVGGGHPVSGTFRPSNAMSVLNGQPMNGNWTFRIQDTVGSDSVCYFSSSITFESEFAPATVNDSYSTNRNVALTVAALTGVLSNDTDAESDPLTAQLVTGPSHGTLTLNADGSFAYTPTAGYAGPDSFTYNAYDGYGVSSPSGTVSINVIGSLPVAGNDTYATPVNTTLTVPAAGVLLNDTNPDGDPMTAVLVTTTAHGVLTLNADGSFTYVPDAGYQGYDTFAYNADNGGFTVEATVTIAVGSVAPPSVQGSLAVDDFGITAPSTALTLDLLANDNGSPLSVTNIYNQTHGTITSNGGILTYTPYPGFYGDEYLLYDVTDGTTTDTGMVVIVVWRPVPLCFDFDGTGDDVVRASVPSTTVPSDAGVYCRIIVENQSYIRPGGEIGIQSIIDLGVLQAVEVFDVDTAGDAHYGYNNGIQICLKGQGRLIYLNAWNMPRTATWLDSDYNGGFTCGWIPNTGTVILVPQQ